MLRNSQVERGGGKEGCSKCRWGGRRSPPEKVTFEEPPEGSEGANWPRGVTAGNEREFQAEGTANAKGLRWKPPRPLRERARMKGQEAEKGGEGDVRRYRRARPHIPCGSEKKDLALSLSERGKGRHSRKQRGHLTGGSFNRRC